MVYDPDKGIEKTQLPEDLILGAVITHIQDGNVKDFITNLEKWKDPGQPAISVDLETLYDNNRYKFSEVFAYRNEGDQVAYGRKSKIGKFEAKYESLPRVGLKVKVMTNAEGYLRVKID